MNDFESFKSLVYPTSIYPKVSGAPYDYWDAERLCRSAYDLGLFNERERIIALLESESQRPASELYDHFMEKVLLHAIALIKGETDG